MEKTRFTKFKMGLLTLSTLGLLAACNTTDDFEENPEMGPPPAEEPVDEEAPAGGGQSESETEEADN